MALDPRLILAQRLLPSVAEQDDERQKRLIQQQEVQLRAQDIQQRGEEMRQNAMDRAAARLQKTQPSFDPKKESEYVDYQTKMGDTITAHFQQALDHPETWPAVRTNIARLVGPQALANLPQDWNDDTANFVSQQVQAWPTHKAAVQKASRHLVTTTNAAGDTVQRFVDDTSDEEYPVPTKPTAATSAQGFTLAPGGRRYDAQGNVIATAPERPEKATGSSSGSNDALVASVLANPSLYAGLPPTTKKNLIPALDKMGFDFAAAGAGKPATQDQSNAAGYARRMEDAEDTIKNVQGDISKMNVLSFAAQSHLPPAGQGAVFQQYDQSARNFINAVLRRESGAAISQSEFDNARRQYLPQPGDKPETLELKRKNRETTLGNLIAAGGPAYKPREKAKSAPKTVGRFTVEVE